jgi:hypothetical protein
MRFPEPHQLGEQRRGVTEMDVLVRQPVYDKQSTFPGEQREFSEHIYFYTRYLVHHHHQPINVYLATLASHETGDQHFIILSSSVLRKAR